MRFRLCLTVIKVGAIYLRGKGCRFVGGRRRRPRKGVSLLRLEVQVVWILRGLGLRRCWRVKAVLRFKHCGGLKKLEIGF